MGFSSPGLADGSVTAAKLAAGAAVSNIGAGGITSNEIAALAVTAAKIANTTITETQMAALSIGTAELIVGAVTPDKQGLTVWNATGSTISAGALLYVSAWNAANSMPQVTLADNIAVRATATYIAQAAISNGASGLVLRRWQSPATQNTNAGNVGDPYFLTTSGAASLAQPTAAGTRAQIVGHIVVKSATVGVIQYDLTAVGVLAWGTPFLQNAAVTGAILSTAAGTKNLQKDLGTLAVTGSEEVNFIAPVAGTLSAVTLTGKDALSKSDTNYLTFTLTNKGQAGAGSTAMLAATAANTTQNTGGIALVAYGKAALTNHGTGANLVVAAGDTLTFTATVTGTLLNTVTETNVAIDFTFTT